MKRSRVVAAELRVPHIPQQPEKYFICSPDTLEGFKSFVFEEHSKAMKFSDERSARKKKPHFIFKLIGVSTPSLSIENGPVA